MKGCLSGERTMRLAIFAGVLIAASSMSASAQTVITGPGTYNQVGGTTYGPNGSTQQQVGGTTYMNSGTTYNQIGNTTYGSNGTTFNQVGNTTYGSNGTTSNTVGNTTYINGPNGQSRTCQHVGISTYCN